MKQESKKYTAIDLFILNDLTKPVTKKESTYKRAAFQCNIDPKINCNTIITSKGVVELQRLFKHLFKNHNQLLIDALLKYLVRNCSIQKPLSSIPQINDFIQVTVFPLYESEIPKSNSAIINFMKILSKYLI